MYTSELVVFGTEAKILCVVPPAVKQLLLIRSGLSLEVQDTVRHLFALAMDECEGHAEIVIAAA